jgi:predicted nucleotidyltransferase
MADPNLQLLVDAARLLIPLLNELVFVGGSTTGLLITDKGAGDVRPTSDVDAITEITSYADYAAFSERLRELGFTEDTREGAPLCRWQNGGTTLDVMPLNEEILGFSNRWYEAAMKAAQERELEPGLHIRVVTAPYFCATKIEAFRGRGRGDYPASHDLEDLATVLDGRPELLNELRSAPDDVRSYIAAAIGQMLETDQFLNALPGYLWSGAASQSRISILLEILNEISTLE